MRAKATPERSDHVAVSMEIIQGIVCVDFLIVFHFASFFRAVIYHSFGHRIDRFYDGRFLVQFVEVHAPVKI